MAVYRRGYQRYQGKIEGRRARFLVLPRFSWKRMFQQRLVVLLLVSAMIWPLICAAFIYISHNADLLKEMQDLGRFLEVDSAFFMTFMTVQKTFAIFLAALTGPGLIAPDVANNALQLYFSRPLTRLDYVLGRLAALMGLLSLVTWIPCLALFIMQSVMAGNGWGIANWRLGFGTIAGFLLWILLVSLTALASSAWVKLRVIAGGLILGFFFILSGVAVMINGVFRGTWGHLLNPSWTVGRIVYALAGIEAPDGPGGAAAIATFFLILLLLVFILERKLRPVEVIS
jgi:ABC-type transport system involved in multi-copper enzyme maturation permease subunit